MNKKRAIIIVIALFFLGFLINGSPFVFGDGYGYFHTAKTLVSTGNFASSQKPEYFDYSGHAVIENKGKYVSIYTAGQSILWWPFLTISKFFDTGTINNDYYKAFNGHSFSDGVAVLAAAAFYGLISFILIYKILKLLEFDSTVSFLSTILIVLSSYVLGYIYMSPSYSHIYELFAVSGMLFFLIRFGKKFEYSNMFYSGLFAGLLVLIRPIDLLVIIPIALYLIRFRNIKANLLFYTGALPLALVFFYYNYISYGSAFSIGYSLGSSTGFDFSTFNLLKLLFSDVRGWFIWSPLLLLGFISLLNYGRKTIPSILLYIFPVIFIMLGYSYWANWWAGDSIGQRFFIVLLPFIAIGLAVFIRFILNKPTLIKRFGIGFAGILSLFSFLTLILYRITPEKTLYTINNNSYPEVKPQSENYSIFDIYNYHTGLLSKPDYFTNLKSGYSGGRSLLLLALGQSEPLIKISKVSTESFDINLIPNNLAAEAVKDITIKINANGSFQKYVLSNVNFKLIKVIGISCNQQLCTSNYSDFERQDYLRESEDRYITISEKLSLSLKADGVKIVDYKL